MESTIFRDIGETIKKFLYKKFSDLLQENAIVFDSPADVELTNDTKLSIFLYSVKENTYLKNVGRQQVGKNRMEKAPLFLDMYYLFTPYAQNRETEWMVLERLFQIFYNNYVFKDEALEGTLKKTGNDKIILTNTNLEMQELFNLWSLFTNKNFRVSTSYIATAIRVPSLQEYDFKRGDKILVSMQKSAKKPAKKDEEKKDKEKAEKQGDKEKNKDE